MWYLLCSVPVLWNASFFSAHSSFSHFTTIQVPTALINQPTHVKSQWALTDTLAIPVLLRLALLPPVVAGCVMPSQQLCTRVSVVEMYQDQSRWHAPALGYLLNWHLPAAWQQQTAPCLPLPVPWPLHTQSFCLYAALCVCLQTN